MMEEVIHLGLRQEIPEPDRSSGLGVQNMRLLIRCFERPGAAEGPFFVAQFPFCLNKDLREIFKPLEWEMWET